MTTRRKFLASCSTITLAATVAPGTVLAAPVPLKNLSLDQLSLATFAKQVQTLFEFHPEAARPVSLRLVRVQRNDSSNPMAVAAPDASNEKFSLLFRGPLAQPLSQDTYQCEHKEMGQFAIFIVPVCGKDTRRGRLYEAVFNRTASNSSQVS